MSMPHPGADPLAALREYRALAPWSLRDLAALAGAILEASGVFPVNAAARARPSERTIRFYVSRNLVSPPEGRGTAAVYSYRHLLQVLAIKLRQMEGATLGVITRELGDTGGDVLERRVASQLGTGLPTPGQLDLGPPTGAPRGRMSRVTHAWPPRALEDGPGPRTCRRLPLGAGAELLIDEQHPALRRGGGEAALTAALRHVIVRARDEDLPADPPSS